MKRIVLFIALLTTFFVSAQGGYSPFGKLRLTTDPVVFNTSDQILVREATTGNIGKISKASLFLDLNPVSATQSGIVNNIALQELGGVDKLINGLRIGRGGGNISGNTAVGFEALEFNTVGIANSASGYQVLTANTTGNYNSGFGNNALKANTTGIYNVGIGAFSLWANTIGQRNTAVGTSSLARSNGSFNTAIGSHAGSTFPATVSTGSSNITVGFQAGGHITTGNNNLLIENITNASITSGSRNIVLNPFQKSGVTTGDNNVIIGGYDGVFAPNMSNTIVLGTGSGAIRYISDETGTKLPAQTVALIAEDTTGKAAITKEYVTSVVKPYKTYVALLTQTGTSAPVATVLENTLGGIVTWTRNTFGNYTGTLVGAFILNKTVGFVQSNNPSRPLSFIANNTANSFEISTNGADDILINASIKIYVYN